MGYREFFFSINLRGKKFQFYLLLLIISIQKQIERVALAIVIVRIHHRPSD